MSIYVFRKEKTIRAFLTTDTFTDRAYVSVNKAKQASRVTYGLRNVACVDTLPDAIPSGGYKHAVLETV